MLDLATYIESVSVIAAHEVEILISRELGGSFESFSSANWQIGVGAAQSFSKFARHKNSANRVRGVVKLASIVKSVNAQPRVIAHIAMAAVLISVVAGSSIGNESAGRAMLRTEGIGSTLDEISTATVAAQVAEKADFMIATDAAKQSEVLNAQVTLPTTSQTALAKRAVVETAGVQDRVVRSYIVEPGDTLSGIAAKFGVTTNTIKWANGLSDVDDLAPGKELTILPVSGLYHTVAKGETAESIARVYHANEAQIISFNNAEVTGLKVGQKIIVPEGYKEEAAPAPRAENFLAAAAPAFTAVRPTVYNTAGNLYSYGYCTWYAKNRRPDIPNSWGNAAGWYWGAANSGYSVGSAPRPGAIAQTSVGYAGHVGIVEKVNGDGTIVISDMNYNGGWGRVTTRVDSAHNYRYIY